MAKKRLQKKNAKRQQTQALKKSGLSEKQIRQLSTSQREELSKPIIAREKRSSNAKQSYKKRDNFIKKYGLKNVKKSNSWETIRTEYFKQQGYKPEHITAEMVKSEKGFKQAANIETRLFVCDEWLYIGYGDPSENIHVMSMKKYYDSYTLEELDNGIEDLRQNVRDGSQGSKGRPGNTVFQRGSEASVKNYMRFCESHQYQTVCCSNQWTLYGLKNILLFVMDLSTEKNRVAVYTGVREYVSRNMPELAKYF